MKTTNMSLKTILPAALLVFGLCASFARAEDKKAAEAVGTWKCEYEIGDQKRTSTLTIKQEGDKLVGTMSWPDQKDEKLKDVKLKDGELTFAAERRLAGGDQKFNVEYKLTVSADKLKGKGYVVVGDDKREFDFEAKPEKKEDKKEEKK